MTAAFWPLLAMVELVALLAAVLICVALAIAGLTVQLRRRRRTAGRAGPVPAAGPISPTPAFEQDEEPDPFPF